MKLPTIEQVHEQFCKDNKHKYNPKNIVKDLEWNCFSVSTTLAKMISTPKSKARAVYGNWEGHCVPKKSSGFHRHGWVLIHEKQSVDPTRWVFEGKAPYIYVPTKTKNFEYDEGMTQLRGEILKPCPAFDKAQRTLVLNWSMETSLLVSGLMGKPYPKNKTFSMNQIFWMANLSFHILGDSLDEIYTTFDQESLMALVPIDYQSKWVALKDLKNNFS